MAFFSHTLLRYSGNLVPGSSEDVIYIHDPSEFYRRQALEDGVIVVTYFQAIRKSAHIMASKPPTQ